MVEDRSLVEESVAFGQDHEEGSSCCSAEAEPRRESAVRAVAVYTGYKIRCLGRFSACSRLSVLKGRRARLSFLCPPFLLPRYRPRHLTFFFCFFSVFFFFLSSPPHHLHHHHHLPHDALIFSNEKSRRFYELRKWRDKISSKTTLFNLIHRSCR